MDRRDAIKKSAALGASAWVAPAVFTFDAAAAAVGSTGVCEVPTLGGGAVWLDPPPGSLAEGGPLESSVNTYVFAEQGPVVLAAPLVTNRATPGTFNGSSNQSGAVPAGTTVCSYYVHADGPGGDVQLSGQLTFATGPIVGLIFRTQQLSASAFLQAPGTTYAGGESEGNDSLTLTANSLSWTLQPGNGLDSVRVIVACP